MGASGRTENYNLPIFNTGDATAWADFNKAMSLLDKSLKNIEVFGNNTNIKTDNNTNAISNIETSVESLQNETGINSVDISNLKAKTDILEKHENEQDLKIVNLESISGENGRDLESLLNRVAILENMDLKARPITFTSENGSVNHSVDDCVEFYANGDDFKLSIINAKLTFRPTTDVSRITFNLDSFNSLGITILDCLIISDGYDFHKPASCMIKSYRENDNRVEIYDTRNFSHEKDYTIYLNGASITLQ